MTYYIEGILYEWNGVRLEPAPTKRQCPACGEQTFAFDARCLCFRCLSTGCRALEDVRTQRDVRPLLAVLLKARKRIAQISMVYPHIDSTETLKDIDAELSK